MALLRGDLDDLLTDGALGWAESAYCQVVVTDPIRPDGALDRLKRRFPRTLRLEFEPTGAAVTLPQSYARRLVQRGEIEVCVDFLEHVRGGRTATPSERRALVTALDASRVDRSVADDEGRRVVSSHAGRGVA
jgi:exonuclease SbcD